MAETPKTVEVNVVMGAQLRAIVRSALIHTLNVLREEMEGHIGLPTLTKADIEHVVEKELEKWPLSADPEDTLADWLDWRYGRYMEPGEAGEDFKKFWEHEANAVRRAVGRGGFKTSPDETEISTPIGDLHQAHENSGGMVKGYRDLELKHAETLGEAIRIAVGAASTCWTDISKAGVFKSEVALDIATQLEHHVMEKITEGIGSIQIRHQELANRLQAYRESGTVVISIEQAMGLLTGRATPADYDSALQHKPGETSVE